LCGHGNRICVAVCPPFPYLALVASNLKGSSVALGAQNLYPKEGAFTGEVSPTMLLDLGCKFVILGTVNDVTSRENPWVYHQKVMSLRRGLKVFMRW